jgi:6-phosphogluconolactonase
MNDNFRINRLLQATILLAFSFISFNCIAQNFYLVVGTYTGTGSKGIYVYNFNVTTGKAKWISNTDSVTNPSYLTISHNGKYIYAVNETNGEHPGKVSAFSFNKNTGSLHFLNSQFTGGDDPCYVATNTNDACVVVANYTGGSLSAFKVNNNGALQPYAQLIRHTGTSINKERQEKAHVHETVFSPDNNYLLAPDLGMDQVSIYKFNQLKKKPLTPSDPPYASITAGSGPRHITFHPNKKFAYLVNELSGTVIVYNYKNGKLTRIQEAATHPENFKGTIGSAEICTSPDGKFLYVSNRGDENTITIFSINATNGKLKLQGYQSINGKAPRNFIIDPTGNYLLVANQETDNIVIFKRDKKTGLLKMTGDEIHIPKPVCLQMAEIKN